MNYLRQSTAASVKFGPFVDDTDGKTPETALVIQKADVRVSKNGGNMAAASSNQGAADAGAPHDELGVYDGSLDATDTGTLGVIRVDILKTGALSWWKEWEVIPATVYDSLVAGSDKLQVDLQEIGGDAQSMADLKDFADAGYDPATNKVEGVKLADTLTTYTGNTPQTGDGYAVVSSGTYGLSALKTLVDTLATYVDTEVAAIKAKTDNLPLDPADASDIAAAFATVDGTLATIIAYIDTEVAAIKAKTDNLPTDPADASDIAASFASIASTLATLASYVDTEVAAILAAVDTEIAAIKAKTDNLPTDPADESSIQAAIADLKTYVDTEILAIKAKTDLIPADPADASDIAASFASIALTLATISGYLDTEIAAILADTNELQTDWVDGGRLDLLIDAIKAKTDNLPTDPADESSIQGTLTTIIGTLATLASYVDTEVAAIKAKTDNLPTDPADASDIAAAFTTINATLATIASYIDTEVAAIKAKTDNLPAQPAAVGSPMTLDFTQVLSMSPTTDTLGEALQAMLGQGKRGWAVIGGSPPRFVVYRADGITEWFSFELDDADAPTTRTLEVA